MTTRERCESAIRYRKNGANCAQSLLAAFADVMGITEAQAMALSLIHICGRSWWWPWAAPADGTGRWPWRTGWRRISRRWGTR